MPDVNANEIITYKNKRAYIQYGGPRPGNELRYAGQDGQYMMVGGLSNPQRGGVTPIYVHDPNSIGNYISVARTEDPPDLPTADYTFYEKHNAIPRTLAKLRCAFNVYVVTGACKSLSDPLGGWTDYVEIHSQALATDIDLGDRVTFDSDEPIESSVSATLSAIYGVGPLGFGEKAAVEVTREAVDVVYGTAIQCGDCGIPNDGSQWWYAVTKSSGSGSPGLPAEVIYSTDGGLTTTQTTITGLGATADPVAIDIVGQYLVILVSSENALYYAEIDTDTGVPGDFTKVTTGFVASKTPNDLYVLSPREVYIVGNGGYIYKSTDITTGVTAISSADVTTENLTRVHGAGEAIVAVGDSGTILLSINRGATFATTQDTPSATLDCAAVYVFDTRYFYVGGNDTSVGVVYYTETGGKTWTQIAFGTNPTNVSDIVWATAEVAYIAYAQSGPNAKIAATYYAGANWTSTRPRVINLPVFDTANRIAVPQTADNYTVNANNLLIAGLAGDGTDGIIVQGVASIL